MFYFLIFLLTLPHCFLIVLVESNQGNIRHLQNGRKANAGVALFPLIPSHQLLFLGLAWLIERFNWFPNAGFYIVTAILLLTGAHIYYSFVKTRKQMQALEAAAVISPTLK